MDYTKMDRKCIKGDYYNDIENGIKQKYGELYKQEITVQYECSESNYYFGVYLNGKTFNKNKIIIDTLILIDKFVNIRAIEIFANKYTLEDFNKKFNDYSEDNYKILKDEIDNLVEEYSKVGFIFDDIMVESHRCFFSFYHPKYNKPYKRFGETKIDKEYYSKWFNVSPISTTTLKACIRDMKKQIERFNAKCIAITLKGDEN